MSHFTVLVIGENLEEQLAPYHEFECTGLDDKYVQTIDRTEEAKQEFAEATVRLLKLADGSLVSPYGEDGNYKPEFLRLPTDEEVAMVEKNGPLGFRDEKLKFETTGYGQNMRVVQFPYNAEDTRQPAIGNVSFAEWAADHFGAPIVKGSLNLAKEHKFGYTLVESPASGRWGEVAASLKDSTEGVKVFDRTNPNKKWDWYQVGGRWTGYFLLKNGKGGQVGEHSLVSSRRAKGGTADVCKKGDVDVERMRGEAAAKAGDRYDEAARLIDGRSFEPWKVFLARVHAKEITVERAREEYHAQSVMEVFRQTKGFEFDGPDAYLANRDEFVEDARLEALCTFAAVQDGKWHAAGRMGWFGISDVEDDVEKAWREEFKRIFDALPDDTLLTIVDCHI